MPKLTASEQALLAAVVGGNTTKVGNVLEKKDGGSSSSAASGGTDRIESAALLLAALHGHVGIIKLFIGRGVDLSASFASASEILRQNVKHGNGNLVRIPKGLGLVSAAVIGRRIPALQCVLRAGADPNALDGVRSNALQVACFDGDDARRLCIVRELLKWGADPNLSGYAYGSTLHIAAKEGHTNLFTTLLAAAPATLNLVDEQGLTPLGTATAFGQHKAVACLLSLGASDREVFQETRTSSLQAAVVAGHDTLLPLLLSGKGLEAVGGLDSIPDAMG